MDAQLAKSIVLTSRARVALAGLAPIRVDVEQVLFAGDVLAFESSAGQVVESAADWVESLRAAAATALALRADSSILVSAAVSSLWKPSSDPIVPRPSDGPVWRLRYREQAAAPPSAADLDVASATTRLKEAFHTAETLCIDGNAAGWAKFFANARDALQATDAPPRKWSFLPDAGYDDPARRLLRGADTGWAFGGMGSWNDFEFESYELRRRQGEVTRQLHAAVIGAVLSATNAALG